VKRIGVAIIDDSTATHVIASDEVGLGSLAGPLCVGVVCAPRDWPGLPGLTDSKKLSRPQKEALVEAFNRLNDPEIRSKVYTYDVEQIDRMGVGKLLPWAHEVAIHEMSRGMDRPLCIVDGSMKISGALSLPKADLLIPACSMAAVLAKVHHDGLMRILAQYHPGYDFENSVGYTSPEHTKGLEKMGPSPVHRRSYSTYDQYKKAESPTNAWEVFDDE
jgi:ribonuclease HII